ncbi:hypothetical protein N7470_005530 [Penicillium chermesinum]|nr:hypothetical protein N7470_005530 [Penicillium chermesinum]
MILSALLTFFLLGVVAGEWSQFDDRDLIHYRTLPNHRVVKWNISYHDKSQVAPGYWFTAPYWSLSENSETKQFIPYQVGPHIFDQDGVLIWAGAVESNNHQAHDFRVIDFSTREDLPPVPHLSWILMAGPGEPDSTGRSVVYNNQYTLTRELSVATDAVDTHEFYVKNSPKAMLIISSKARVKLSELGMEEASDVASNGFAEVDLNTGEETFRWMSTGKITLDESYVMTPERFIESDYLHMNSVDKNENGDFLISARHTSAIYLISGPDFTFCGQHDARFLSITPDAANPTSMVISFLDNGAILTGPWGTIGDEPTSSGMIVELDLVAMKATLLKRFMRPDGGSTDRRGNMQSLPNGNKLLCWSYGGYVTEFDADGNIVMEASTYKLPWVGRPSYPPTVVAELYGTKDRDPSTLFHVSWNGATDIAYWRFYARNSSASTRREIGLVPKSGFETTFLVHGHTDWVSVEALDSDYQVLGRSPDSRPQSPDLRLSDAVSPGMSNETSADGGYVLTPVSGDADGPRDYFFETSAVHIVQRGGFIAPFILGIAFSAGLFALLKWRRPIVKYCTSAYNWMTWTGYTMIWQDERGGF